VYFAIIGLDRPGTADLRQRTRAAHREYLHADHPAISLKLAGPLLSRDGNTMVGSLIVVQAADLAAAESFSASDPYRSADLFEEVTIRPWSWSTGNPDK
jgi:uncharacterized protein